MKIIRWRLKMFLSKSRGLNFKIFAKIQTHWLKKWSMRISAISYMEILMIALKISTSCAHTEVTLAQKVCQNQFLANYLTLQIISWLHKNSKVLIWPSLWCIPLLGNLSFLVGLCAMRFWYVIKLKKKTNL